MAKKSVLEYSVSLLSTELTNTLVMTDEDKSQIIYSDLETGSVLVLDGEGFKVKAGKIIAGTVEHFTVFSDQGKELMEFSGISVKAKPLPQDQPIDLLTALLQQGLMKSNIINGSKQADILPGGNGDDVIKGGKGDDYIDGYRGRDVLSGGGGEDQFLFGAHYGKDKVLDFDADGTDGSQDIINAVFADMIDKKTVHGNAMLDFGDGDVLTLIGVRAKDIDETDFVA